MRQIVLDTETTGLSPQEGHRIIEIGCVEVVERKITQRNYHQYLQPDRLIDQGAIEVHGITNEYLADKPRFNRVVDDFLAFIKGAELIIHNADFDVGFLNHELNLLDQAYPRIQDICEITDTLKLARSLHPGQQNSLDALCRRYEIDNSARTKHGALLDSEILADVYLMMTGGQITFDLPEQDQISLTQNSIDEPVKPLKIQFASPEELAEHGRFLEIIRKAGDECLWDRHLNK